MSAELQVDVSVRRAELTVTAAFDLGPGERLAIMGPSGAGKTTVLEAIAGLAELASGRVRVDGEVVAAPGRQVAPQRRGTVLLRQDPALFPHLSARENVAFGLRARGVAKRVAHGMADEMLERVGLADAGGRAPRELSGGQQQRVALARALAGDPRVVLLDEPFTALDPETASALRTVLAEQLRAAGATTVFVSHDALDAVAVAERLIVIENGEVTQSGSVRSVLTAPATRFGAAIAGLNRIVGRVEPGIWRSGRLSVAVSGGAGCGTAGGARGGAAGPADREAVALVRPSDIRLRPVAAQVGSDGADTGDAVADDRPVAWTGVVDRLEPTVAGVRVHVADPAIAVDVAVTDAAELRPGTAVHLSFDPSAIVWA